MKKKSQKKRVKCKQKNPHKIKLKYVLSNIPNHCITNSLTEIKSNTF